MEVCKYLNEVLEYYGPPCNFCEHFDLICKKLHRPQRYSLALGPFDEWYIKKFCQDFRNIKQNSDNDIRGSIERGLDSFVQEYC